MLQVWGRISSGSTQKVLWACEELGLPYDLHNLGGEFGGNDTSDYLAMNPNGRVPTIWDGDFSLWESNACVRYLAEKYGDGSLYPEKLETRADADRWMDWQQTTLLPAYNDMHFGLIRMAPEERNQETIEASRKNTGGCMAILNEVLAEHEFVTGSLFTVADIALGVIPYRWFALDISRPRHVHLERWYSRLTEREPYRKIVMQPLPEWA